MAVRDVKIKGLNMISFISPPDPADGQTQTQPPAILRSRNVPHFQLHRQSYPNMILFISPSDPADGRFCEENIKTDQKIIR